MARSLLLFLTLLLLSSCSGNTSGGRETTDEDLHSFPDTLRIGTVYGPLSYFRYRDELMGYDYSLACKLAHDKDLVPEFIVASSLTNAVEMLDSGKIDLIACDVPVTSEFLERVVPCAYEHLSTQVLVQKKSQQLLKDVTELVGKDIYVESESKYLYRLQNLNEELGGGINIFIVEEDSMLVVDLLDLVSRDDIPYTVIDSENAKLNKGYYPDLDTSLQLSFPQRSSWAVSKSKEWLADSINAWFQDAEIEQHNKHLLRRYFELSRIHEYDLKNFSRNFNDGYISNYDTLFKRYGLERGVDWRLLAAVAYGESKFNNSVTSWAGARGVMQIMPSAARAFGVNVESLTIPEVNISLAARILNTLDNSLEKYVSDPEERTKFVLAAYNSGIAHILDAISIAAHSGLNPAVWNDNVAVALKMKSQPEIYNNRSICKYGYFKGTYTVAYVQNVMNLYNKAKEAF